MIASQRDRHTVRILANEAEDLDIVICIHYAVYMTSFDALHISLRALGSKIVPCIEDVVWPEPRS